MQQRTPFPLRILSAALLALLAACAADPMLVSEFERAAEAEMARRPEHYANGEARAFLVSRGGRERGMLWGTMHVSYSDDTMPPASTRARMVSAASLHVEAAPGRQGRGRQVRYGAIVRAATDAPDPDALAALDPVTRGALGWVPLPAGAVGRYSLLGLAMLAGGPQSSIVPSLSAASNVDGSLAGFAVNRGVAVHGLDTPDQEDAAIRSLYADPNGEAGAGALRQVLRRRPASRAFGDWVMRTYAAGQVGRVVAGMVAWRAEPGDLARADARRDALFTARNAAWIVRLEAAYAEPGFHAAAFGAGHLLGEDGVVALLRRQGWTVTACPDDAC